MLTRTGLSSTYRMHGANSPRSQSKWLYIATPQPIRVLIGEIEVLHAITPQHLHRFTQRCLGLGRD